MVGILVWENWPLANHIRPKAICVRRPSEISPLDSQQPRGPAVLRSDFGHFFPAGRFFISTLTRDRIRSYRIARPRIEDTDEGKEAIKDGDLLKQVADHKAVFFRSAWASYDTARVGTLQLSPHPDRIADLRADYRKMAPMVFDDPPPTFDDVLKRIAALEKAITALKA
jgi:hypothetical protein